ncbi:PR domain zinc finger protein 13 [Thelohanellus kitauei]|uniref:PR domain zinc finger protein 13 n=1 Tax=Thelohanellus kitauei TaxID=669202 RepID=A0A0C2MNE3_THEKT|nr:PR domain zinc finger protein 13 [Thelohanellus kitauei]
MKPSKNGENISFNGLQDSTNLFTIPNNRLYPQDTSFKLMNDTTLTLSSQPLFSDPIDNISSGFASMYSNDCMNSTQNTSFSYASQNTLSPSNLMSNNLNNSKIYSPKLLETPKHVFETNTESQQRASRNQSPIVWDLDPNFNININELEITTRIEPTNDMFNFDPVFALPNGQNAFDQQLQPNLLQTNGQNLRQNLDFVGAGYSPRSLNSLSPKMTQNGLSNINNAPRFSNANISPPITQITDESISNSAMNFNQLGSGAFMYQSINIPNFTNPQPQNNVIVRALQNGQMHLVSIDQNVLQQMVSNQRRDVPVQNVGITNNLMPNNLINTVPATARDPNQNSIVQKNLETLDLMENPANWRRLPNNGGYQCNICNKCYTRKYGLKIHLRIHSGFKPLECKVCRKKFGDPSNMAKHIRLHSTEGSPYKCNLCNKQLVRRRDLERHMRSRHPDTPSRPNPDNQQRNNSAKL